MKIWNNALRWLATVAAVAVILGMPAQAAGAKTGVMDTPTLACAGSSKVTINLLVTAGTTTGAPAGFTVQWETKADFLAYGWPSDAFTPTSYCDASFSGNASNSRYNLLPGQSVTVTIGDILLDNGASTSCPQQPLACGTEYVFRVFAHATKTLTRSAFSGNWDCSTLPCGDAAPCTLTQGYWVNHPCAWPFPFEPTRVSDQGDPKSQCTSDIDPTHTMMLGNTAYTQEQLMAILNMADAGNGLLKLAHQLIAAKLNIAKGVDGSLVAETIVAADTLIGNLVVGTDYLKPSKTSTLSGILDQFNNGQLPDGPKHCD